MENKTKTILFSVIAGVFIVSLIAGVAIVGKTTAVTGAATVSCEWSWPQKVVVDGTTYPCSSPRFYCNRAEASCCQYSKETGYFNCEHVVPASSGSSGGSSPSNESSPGSGGSSSGTNISCPSYYLNNGESVTVARHTITLEDVGDGIVAISVDGGEIYTIHEGDKYCVPEGMEIEVLNVFYPSSEAANLRICEECRGGSGGSSDPDCADLDSSEPSYADISGGSLQSVVTYVSKVGPTVDGVMYPFDKKEYGKHYLLFNTVNSGVVTVRVCQKNGENWFVGGNVYTVPLGATQLIDDGMITYLEYIPSADGALLHISMDN